MSRCSRPYSDDVVKPLSINEQLPFRLAILTSSASHRNHRERTSDSKNDGARWIGREPPQKFPYPTIIRQCSVSTIPLYRHYFPACRFFGIVFKKICGWLSSRSRRALSS
ncbi:hypothetical protein DPMN_013458 [Dreissena polymorpha]|uniref:Uncharacterized protein n=1 Tax=Dreissena polymorpha TaxID=45954 RepID=A0A9D4N900_DREPO|nr:hypothetical protein DPMN_013458 [Dreissena polymorpha]